MSKGTTMFVFLLGAAVGSVVTWRLVKNRYEQIAQEEIDSVKEVFSRKKQESEAEKLREVGERMVEGFKAAGFEDGTKNPLDLKEYADTVQQAGYVNYSDNTKPTKEVSEPMDECTFEPYVITPEEFDTRDDYTAISFTYYEGDKILADDKDDIIEDADSVVGKDFASHFGEYEDDCVFIRDDKKKVDYEILLDVRSYLDVVNNDPH